MVDAVRAAVGDRSLTRIPPHLTLVPPVNVRAEQLGDATDRLRDAAARCGPFTLTIGPPTTFLPDNPVLFLAVSGAPAALRALHGLRDAVFRPPLARELAWPYVPHVTLADESPPDRLAAAVVALADLRFAVTFDRVHLLREEERTWKPIADAKFGSPAVVGRGAVGLELELTESTQLDPAASTFAVQQWVLHDEERHGRELARSWDESGLAITARRDGAVVGTATGWTNLGVAHLSELIVDRTARGEGIGAHLLAAFEAACRARGAHRLALRTEGNGPAQPFYVRHGWHVETTIRDWTFGVDVVQMRKDLGEA